jgi:hypothetical protein
MANGVFLYAAAPRRLGDPHNYFVFQTNDENVAKSETPTGQSRTNVNFSSDNGCFFRCDDGVGYTTTKELAAARILV